MDYIETMSTLDSMRSRYEDGFSTIDRSLLDKLHFLLFGREITNRGCGDCYRDAYILIYNHLKKIKAMPKPSLYKLKLGVVIQFFGESNVYSNSNLTDEIAERFLAKNSANKRFFSDLPSNWEERVATRIATASNEKDSQADPDVLSKLTDKLAENEKALAEKDAKLKELEEKNSALIKENVDLKLAADDSGKVSNEDNSEKDQEIANLNLELSTLQGENASLKEEITTLKNENRALKSANTRLKNNIGGEATNESPAENTETAE